MKNKTVLKVSVSHYSVCVTDNIGTVTYMYACMHAIRIFPLAQLEACEYNKKLEPNKVTSELSTMQVNNLLARPGKMRILLPFCIAVWAYSAVMSMPWLLYYSSMITLLVMLRTPHFVVHYNNLPSESLMILLTWKTLLCLLHQGGTSLWEVYS